MRAKHLVSAFLNVDKDRTSKMLIYYIKYHILDLDRLAKVVKVSFFSVFREFLFTYFVSFWFDRKIIVFDWIKTFCIRRTKIWHLTSFAFFYPCPKRFGSVPKYLNLFKTILDLKKPEKDQSGELVNLPQIWCNFNESKYFGKNLKLALILQWFLTFIWNLKDIW